MILIWASLGLLFVVCFYLLRFHVSSVLIYLSAGFEKRTKGVEVLHSLRQNLVHERKKKIAGLEMILSSWEKGEEVQPRYEYYQELLQQLKELVQNERRNLMAVTTDVFLWARLWRLLIRIDKMSRAKGERSNVVGLRRDLAKFRELLDEVVEDATERFSFSLNDAVRESLKTVRIEKSGSSDIKIEESLDDVGDTIRFSYSKFKEWQRLLTNLIRNAVEAVEAKQRAEGIAEGFSLRGEEEPVAAGFSLRGGEESLWVGVSTKESKKESGRAAVPDLREDKFSEFRRQGSPASGGICQRHDQPCTEVEVVIEDSGIGMDEIARSSFFKKGFTSGKEHGLGLGVTEECVEMIGRYGGWQIESKKGVGTRIIVSIDQDRARKGELILPEAKPFYRTRFAFGLYFFLLVLIGLALLFTFDKYSRFWVDWNPAYAKVEQGRQVAVFNSDLRELWEHEFDLNVTIGRGPVGGDEHPIIKVEDLDQDGWNEVLVVVEAGLQSPDQLFCLDHKGNVKWVFSAGQGYDEGRRVDTVNTKHEIFGVKDLLVESFMDSPKKQILVRSQHFVLYPYQIAMLNHEGGVIGEYWHPGNVPFSFYTDIDGDGEKELICAGINNKLNCRPVIFILGMKEFAGKTQGPPYTAFGDLRPAKEKKYVVVPHIKNVNWTWVEVSPLNTPWSMVIPSDYVFLSLLDGRHYSLTRDLQYRSCEFRTAAFVSWREDISFPFDVDLGIDSLNWSNFEVFENGIKVR